MGKHKGSAKTGGRQKGSPNKVTIDTRKFIDNLIEKNLPKMEQDLGKIEPRERLSILEKLLQYTIPRLQSISVEAQIQAKIQAEYSEMEQLLNKAPDAAIEAITDRLIKLNELNKNNDE